MARRIVPLLLMLLIAGGCAAVEHVQDRIAERIELHRSRHEAHVASKQQCHDQEMAQLEQAQAQAQRESIDSLRSTLTLDLDQRFVVSDMQIDEDGLKELMAKRDKDYEELKKLWDEMEAQMLEARTDQQLDYLQGKLRELQARAAENGCCAAPPCEQPAQVPELPAKRPILPAEIPMVIKVRMRMGMENLGVERARIRRLPTLPAKVPCAPVCKPNGCDERCNCAECQERRGNQPHTNYDDGGPVRLPPPRRGRPNPPAPAPPDDLVGTPGEQQASFTNAAPRRQPRHPNDWVSAPR